MSFFRGCLSALIGLAVLLSCGGQNGEDSEKPAVEAAVEAQLRSDREIPEVEDENLWPLVVFLGDSLTAGLGVAAEDTFPAVLAKRLAEEGQPIRFVNAGISGDTSAGGLNRTDWILSTEPDLVVVALGANDGLRGFEPAETEENLRQILRKTKAAGARALLVGIYLPSNYGPDYSGRFTEIFPRLAEEEQVPLLPFLLEGVAGVPELNQADGVHPNREGQQRVAEHVRAPLSELLREAASDG